MKRLSITYGIHAKALQWFSSYLSDCQQSVTIGSISSKPVPLQSGVPHGSVLGPILFTLSTQPLCNTIQKHQSDYHKYADDTELQKAALPSDLSQVSREIEVCVVDVKDWMNKNKLKLSEEKTELLVVGDSTRLCEVKKEPLTFGPNAVPFQTSAKYLGVHLDETLSMKEQVTSLCRSSDFHLRKIASIRPYLSDESTAQLVPSLILSRLDYCNSTLSGLPSPALNQLQKVQNNAARLVLCKRKSDHVTPLLEKLHWLPVEARIHNKIATLAFRHFENSLPPYLSELLHAYQPFRTLRSSSEKLLKVPKTNLKSAENRSFHFQTANIWNSLPTNVRSSQSLSSFNLKTHLFKERFSLAF